MKKHRSQPAFPFLLILLAAIFFASCNSYKQLQAVPGNADCVKSFKPHFKRSLYNTQVDIVRSHISGLLLIKQMPDSTTRIVFSSETGFKFFDFAFDTTGNCTVHYMLDKMNRDVVVKTLQNDFRMLLMLANTSNAESFKKGNEYYYRLPQADQSFYYITDSACQQLLRAEATAGKKPGTTMYYQPYTSQLPDSVFIKHRGVKFHIALKRIDTATTGN